MDTVFLACAVIGGALLVLQLVLSALGLGHDLGFELHHDVDVSHAPDALNLLSVRALAAGLAFFGLGGLFVMSLGAPALLAVPVGVATGLASAAGVAYAMRQLLRLESDGTIRLEGAVGQPATVYLSIPAERQGAGKVHLRLQGRTVEYQAVSDHPLPTGASVVVVDVVGPDTVEVAPTPDLGGLV